MNLYSLGKGKAGSGCGQEAGEEGGEAWDVHAELGGRGGSDSLCDVGVDQGAMGVRH